MPASYPTSVKTFTTKSDGAGNTILAAHVNDLQAEVTAIETDLLTAFPSGGADGGQLKFPATQNPSADANTLDDYEEGTYTPSWTGSSVNPAIGNGTITGRYIKVGKLVSVSIRVLMGSTTTFGTGQWLFTVPFANIAQVAIGHAAVFEAPGGSPYAGQAYLGASGTNMFLYSTGQGWTDSTPLAWAVDDELHIHVTYEASA